MSDNKITVISPDGVEGSIPASQLLDARAAGYRIPTTSVLPTDIGQDKKSINVYSPDGQLGSIPIDQFDAAKTQGFTLASQYDFDLQNKIKENQTTIDSNKDDIIQLEKTVNEQHKSDDVQDENGNYKLVTPNGEEILAPVDKLEQYLSDPSITFKDKNFQALIKSRVNDRKKDVGENLVQGGNTWGNTSAFGIPEYYENQQLGQPGVLTSIRELFGNETGSFKKADLIAERLLRPEYRTARTVGTVAGLVTGAVLTPGSAIESAATNVVGKVAPTLLAEGAGLGTRLAAKTAIGMVEGAIYSAPQALVQTAINNDPLGSAESLGIGIGLGGVLGFGGKLAGETLGLGKKLLSGAKIEAATNALSKSGASEETLQELANQKVTGKTFFADKFKSTIEHTTPSIDNESMLNTLLRNGADKAKTPDAVESILRKVSIGEDEKILSSLKEVDKSYKYIADSVSFGRELEPQLDKLASSLSSAGQEQLDLFGQGVSKATPTSKFVKEVSDKLTSLSEQKSGKLSDLQKIISEVSEGTNWKKPDALDLIKRNFINDANKELVSSADRIAETIMSKSSVDWAKQSKIMSAAQDMHGQLLKDIDAGKLSTENSAVMNAITNWTSKTVGNIPTAVGFAGGGSVGGLIGHSVSESLSGKTKNIINNLVDSYTSNPNSNSKLINWLKTNKASQAISSYVTMDAIQSMNAKIDSMVPFIKSGLSAIPNTFIAHQDPVKSLLGSEANGLSKAQQYDRISAKLNTLANDNAALNAHIDNVTASLQDHPELAKQMGDNISTQVKYLDSIVNKKSTNMPTAFSSNSYVDQLKKQPTPAEMKEIEEQLKLAQNPFALLDNLKNKTLTSKQVETVNVLYPAILQKMRDQINKQAYSGKVKLDYQQRLAISKITGQPMDPSLMIGADLQNAYGLNQPSKPTGETKKKNGNSHKIDPSTAASYTMSQRITGGK